MSKRANPMAIKAALTYEVGEAARALGKSQATIRNWIRDGLPVMASQKPYLISGAELRDYLRAKYNKTKTPLAPDTLYCMSCRAGRKPAGMEVFAIPNTAKTTRLEGRCGYCGAKASRLVSTAKTQVFTEIFRVRKGGVRSA